MAANPSNVLFATSDLNRLIRQAHDLILQQRLLNQERFNGLFEKMYSNDDELEFSLPTIIEAVRLEIDSHDYLERCEAVSPIEFFPEAKIPPIFKALKLLLDVACMLYQNHPDYHKSDYKNRALHSFRMQQLIGQTDKPNEFEYFMDTFRHFHQYPVKLYIANKAAYDRIDIDFILREEHYSTLPLIKSIRYCTTQILPGFVSLTASGSSRSAQYDPITKECRLLDGTPWGNNKIEEAVLAKDRGSYPLRMCATGISNCHAVLVRDSRNRIFLLHVSPKSMNSSIWGPPEKSAYSELHQSKIHPDIGLKCGDKVDVFVVDRRGWFNESRLEEELSKSKIQIESIKTYYVAFKQGESVSVEANDYYYTVCYSPESNELTIISEFPYTQAIEIKDVFPLRHDVELVQDDDFGTWPL